MIFETGRRAKEQAVHPCAVPSDWSGHGTPRSEEKPECEKPEPGAISAVLETALRPSPPICRHDPPSRVPV